MKPPGIHPFSSRAVEPSGPRQSNSIPPTPRIVALDCETTGLSWRQGHRVIEIAAVEIQNGQTTGRYFHHYLNPHRSVDRGAFAVHGLSNEMLKDKPPFHAIAHELLDFLRDARLVIHNAPFDVGFLDHELTLCNKPDLASVSNEVIDTVALSRRAFPGQKASLDALCERLGIDTAERTQHGALIDAKILAQAYLALAQHLDGHGETSAANMPRYHLRSRGKNTDRLSVIPGELRP